MLALLTFDFCVLTSPCSSASVFCRLPTVFCLLLTAFRLLLSVYYVMRDALQDLGARAVGLQGRAGLFHQA